MALTGTNADTWAILEPSELWSDRMVDLGQLLIELRRWISAENASRFDSPVWCW
jgi:hypothetical protein